MRVFLFNNGKDPDSLHPTLDALKLHINRAHFQTTIWMNATVPTPERIDLETCGWERDPYSNQLKQKLLLLEPIPKVCTAVAKCVQQDGANVDQIISNAPRLVATH